MRLTVEEKVCVQVEDRVVAGVGQITCKWTIYVHIGTFLTTFCVIITVAHKNPRVIPL